MSKALGILKYFIKGDRGDLELINLKERDYLLDIILEEEVTIR